VYHIKEMPETINKVLSRGVEQILPSKKGLADLMRKRKIRLYLGIDPTSPDIHLGHTIPLRKLREFQDLGHEVILLFGTFTAQIGDPSARTEKRKALTSAQITKNMATYRKQASKILDFKKAKIKYNGDWLANLSFEDLAELASHFTVPQLLERDMFQERVKKGKEIWISEFLYPLMQGYDSVAMNVDLEIGATDQTFNMLVGRKLQKIYNNKEKFVLTTPLLLGLDGRKMSKTYGNTVNLTDPPNEMYGKLMSLKDELITEYFKLCTDLPIKEIRELAGEAKKDPMGVKKRLAHEITKMYHGEKKATEAQREFERVVQKREQPKRIPLIQPKDITIRYGSLPTVFDITKAADPEMSTSAVTRLINQGGVEIDNVRYTEPRKEVKLDKDRIVRIGKRGYKKIKAIKKGKE